MTESETSQSKLGAAPAFQRILLKLSGEALASESTNIDGDIIREIATQVVRVLDDHPELSVAIVVGGGNIWRGQTGAMSGMDRAQADYMGMLATVMNALALQDVFERLGRPTRVQSAIHMAQVAEPYIRRRALRHLEKGRIVIFAGGNGGPYFTTDTTAALRAVEIEAEIILKGTHSGVKGVYTADPNLDPDAVLLDELTFKDVLTRELKVMDATAISLAMENDLPIVVFDLLGDGNFRRIVEGDRVGTLVQ